MVVNQDLNEGQWVLLGTYPLSPGQNHRAELTDQASGLNVIADAVRFDPQNGRPHTAIWTPDLPQANSYEVYAKWRAVSGAGNATNVTYTVFHDAGSTGVVVNQDLNEGQWVSLGTYALTPGQNHRVEVTDQASGLNVIADAVLFDAVDAPRDLASWTPALPSADSYRVWARWRYEFWGNNADGVRYTVHHDGGTTEVVKNQSVEMGQWVLLGTFAMTPGQGHRVEVIDTTVDPAETRAVIADAMVFDPQNGARNTATWTPALAGGAGEYDVYASWGAYVAHATDAPYRVHHEGGVDEIRVNQKIGPYGWHYLGRYQLDPANNARVTLSDDANGWVSADAINFVPAASALDVATWTLDVPARDYYDVLARWPASWPNTSYATYTLYHDGGATETVHDQKVWVDGSGWASLGTVVLDPAGDNRVTLDDRAQWDGDLAADAIKFVPSQSVLRDAVWPVSVSTSGQYRVYARWPARPDNAVDAIYTVHHATGQTAVSQNQRVNGTGWNYLGTYPLDPGGNHKVVLTSATNDAAVADAIHVVADPELATATFNWTPALPSAGDYEVFAKWMAASDRESDSVYTVTHATGTAGVTVNQRANGGRWVSLGTFTLDLASAKVVLSGGGGTGSLSADAVRFVAAGPPPANVYYVHTDHLGTPRLMTDASAAVVWDRQSYPFGATYSTAGLGDSAVRFPGQYFDAESGLHYNYFRDYDPAIGRYIQSDPIGLNGGLNTYAYVHGNPLARIDPYGQNYLDFNATIFGGVVATFGLIFDFDCWRILWYSGGGIGTAGGSITWSPDTASPGLNAGGTVGIVGGVQYGIGPGGFFKEYGFVWPGASATVFDVQPTGIDLGLCECEPQQELTN